MRRLIALVAVCIMATFTVALCGCEDLGAYEDVDAYLDCFENVVFVDSRTAKEESFEVATHFYSEESREDFLTDDAGYHGVPHGEYIYVSFPLKSTLTVDSFALYLHSETNVSVRISIYVTDGIPSVKAPESDNESDDELDDESDGQDSGQDSEQGSQDGSEKKPILFNEPLATTWVGDVTVHLENGKWDSFVLENFRVNGVAQGSMEITSEQCILLQIKNNVPVEKSDQGTQGTDAPQTELALTRASITMTNLLVRALNIGNGNEAQGGN